MAEFGRTDSSFAELDVGLNAVRVSYEALERLE
jgi:hypothetical protein